MLVVALLAFKSNRWVASAQDEVTQSLARSKHLGDTLSLLKDAETGQRGYIITGNESFLEPYFTATRQLGQSRRDLGQAMDPVQGAAIALAAIDRLIELKLSELAWTISLRRTQGMSAVEPVVSGGSGKRYMDGARNRIDALMADEDRRRVQLDHELEARRRFDALASIGVTIVNMLLLGKMVNSVFRLMRQREVAERALLRGATELSATVQSLQQRNREITLVKQMARALDAPQTQQEAAEIGALFCARLMPGSAGLVYLYNASRDTLDRVSFWGEPLAAAEQMAPHDCWGLRRSQAHWYALGVDLLCPHLQNVAGLPNGSCCVPLSAQGQILGLLSLQHSGATGQTDPLLLASVSEQISLCMSNNALRESLRVQSIVDPLTGLYNRRFLDETLRRELSRAKRSATALSLIFVDLDHFSRFNNTFGHEVGDAVLRLAARQFKLAVRDGDAACRFGGEEFVLILPGCDKASAASRAEAMREALAATEAKHNDLSLGNVTASFGVASFPDDGDEVDQLFHLADRAMYRAKEEGRNRVMLAQV